MMLHLLLLLRGLSPRPLIKPGTHARCAPAIRMCELPSPEAMRLKDLKQELDERQVSWRGVCFEKDELVSRLREARAAGGSSPPTEDDPTDEAVERSAPQQEEGAAYDQAYDQALAAAMKLKVKELRAELAGRQLGWADLFEKEELAARLAGAVARSALFSRSGALVPGVAREVTAEQLLIELEDTRTPLVVDVFATWCGPCKLMAPQLDALAASAGERVRVAKLDSDAHSKLSTELQVHGLPTVIFYSNGKEVHRLEGMPPGKDALKDLASQYLGI